MEPLSRERREMRKLQANVIKSRTRHPAEKRGLGSAERQQRHHQRGVFKLLSLAEETEVCLRLEFDNAQSISARKSRGPARAEKKEKLQAKRIKRGQERHRRQERRQHGKRRVIDYSAEEQLGSLSRGEERALRVLTPHNKQSKTRASARDDPQDPQDPEDPQEISVDITDWMFDRRKFLEIANEYGPFTVDVCSDNQGANGHVTSLCPETPPHNKQSKTPRIRR